MRAALRVLPSFVRYAGVGAIATAAHYLVLVLCVELLDVAAPTAAAGGALVGAAVSYAGNRGFTFGSAAPHGQALPRFLAVSLGLAAAHAALVRHGMLLADWNYLQAQAAATVLLLCAGFLVHRSWSFA